MIGYATIYLYYAPLERTNGIVSVKRDLAHVFQDFTFLIF